MGILQYGLLFRPVALMASTANATFTTAYLNNYQISTVTPIPLLINNSQKPILLQWVIVDETFLILTKKKQPLPDFFF